MRHLVCAFGTLFFASSAAAQTGSEPPPPPPPVVIPHAPPRVPIPPLTAENAVLLNPTTTVTCNGQAVRPIYSEDLPPQIYGQTLTTPQVGQRIANVSLAFSVTEDGRPLDIRQQPNSVSGADSQLNPGASARYQSVLAAWRFADGARSDCSLNIRLTPVALDRADESLLLRYYAVTRTSGVVREAVEARLRGQDADCQPRRRRLVGLPDHRIGGVPPGGQAWSVVRWNIDAAGAYNAVETVGSSGDAAYDAEIRRAVAESRAHEGAPSTGCIYNFYRWGETLPAPPKPSAPDDVLANCPLATRDRFTANRNLIYPDGFRQRGIEGWALVRFDIATWGAIGNVEVIEAQPAAAFGDSALNAVRYGTATPAFEAGIRCVVPVNFVMSPPPAETPN